MNEYQASIFKWELIEKKLPEKIRQWLLFHGEAPDPLGQYALERLQSWDEPTPDEVLEEIKSIQREKFEKMMASALTR